MKNRLGVLAALISLGGMLSQPALALPVGPTVVSGSASVSGLGSTVVIDSNNALIDWGSFSVAAGEAVDFVQPSSSSGVDSRVLGTSILEIFGVVHSNRPLTLRADSIYVAPGGVIDAPGLSLFADHSVLMAGLIQGGGALNIVAPSIYVKGPLVSDGVVVQTEDYYGSGSLSLGSSGGSFSGITTVVSFDPSATPIAFDGPGFITASAIPEPSSLVMAFTGLLAMVGFRRRVPGG